MFGTLPVITMRKKDNDSILCTPFLLSIRYKIINNHLCSICKVSKLGFPHYKSIRIVEGEAILKSKDAKF